MHQVYFAFFNWFILQVYSLLRLMNKFRVDVIVVSNSFASDRHSVLDFKTISER